MIEYDNEKLHQSVSRRIATLPALKRKVKNPVYFRIFVIQAAAAAENAVNRGATRGSAAELHRSPEVHIASEGPVRCVGFLRGQVNQSIFANPRCSGIFTKSQLDGLELEILSFCVKDTVLAFTARSPLHAHKVGHVT